MKPAKLFPAQRRFSALCLLTASLGLSSCSAPQLAYNKLDWLASWELRKYVRLNHEQTERYNREFDRLWEWHRKHELKLYVADMRTLAAQITAPLSAEQIIGWMQRVDSHWNRTATRLAPVVCAQLANFDDAQVDSVLQRLDHNIEEQTEEFLAPPEDEVRADSERRLLKKLRQWVGNLDDYQQAQIHQWSMQRALNYDDWLAEKKIWRDAFARVLSHRQASGFCDRIQSLFLRYEDTTASGGLKTRNDRTRRQWAGFLAGMMLTMSEQQREHMQARLLDLATDFEALAER